MGEQSAKRAVIEELLEQGMVLVTLDATADGVEVPTHLRNDAQLRLNLSYRFGLPMQVDDTGIRATLTFGGVPYDCRLPWNSVYLVVSHVTGRPVLFPEDVPHDLMRILTEQVGAGEEADSRPKLTVISGEPPAQPAAESEEPAPPAPSRRARPHLRVVK